MAEVAEPEILNLRPVDRSIERVLDVVDGLAFKLSFQVNKDISVRAGLLVNFPEFSNAVSFNGKLWGRPLLVRLSMRMIRRLKSTWSHRR
jgi:hypothetical protein